MHQVQDVRGTGPFPESRSVMTRLLSELPALTGALHVDPGARELMARDAGGLVSKLPGAVLRPRSADDVANMVALCRRHAVKVVARGQAHTTFGQAQVEGGLLIDMRSLNRIHHIDRDVIDVDAGATWRVVLEATAAQGRTPPVLTGYQGLTVGGTLSVSGISGAAYKRGPQVEHVLELELVTGEGRRLICSPCEHRELFEAALGGLGRCAVIVRAKLRLVKAPAHVQVATLTFDTASGLLKAMRELVRSAELDSLSANIFPLGSSGARYELNALRYSGSEHPAALDEMLASVSGERAPRGYAELSYLDHCLQVDRLLERLEVTRGWEGLAHPWFDAFLPDSSFERFLGAVIPQLDPQSDVGPPALGALGQIHVFPLLTRHLTRPLLRVPDEPLVYLFDILTSAHEHAVDSAYRRRMIERNCALFERAQAVGGTRYNIAALPMNDETWARELGPALRAYAAQKSLHDPAGILGAT